METVNNLLKAAIYECVPPNHAEETLSSETYLNILHKALEDLDAFCLKDPASFDKRNIVAHTSLPFSAVIHYRLAHGLLSGRFSFHHDIAELYSSLLSNRGKLKSGAEIHHKAIIGNRFVLDHGFGTVIGETSIIGEDCYFLGNVILGATGISNNPNGERHVCFW